VKSPRQGDEVGVIGVQIVAVLFKQLLDLRHGDVESLLGEGPKSVVELVRQARVADNALGNQVGPLVRQKRTRPVDGLELGKCAIRLDNREPAEHAARP
jgi:hypothetical protein